MARADADGGQGASAAASDADPGPSACSPPDAAVSGGVGLDAGASGADADARPQRRIGLVGRISPWKGQDVFIRAARQVRLRCPDTEFLIIGSAMFGETQYEQELHRLVVECGLQSCTRFLGFRHDIDAVIHSLDVLVHASTAPEPFGQVVVDGMAAGTPVVATRGGGVTEIVDDGVTGLLVTMGSADEMAEAIVATLCDPARAAERAAAARRAVMDRFTIEATVASVQSVYDRLAPQGRRA